MFGADTRAASVAEKQAMDPPVEDALYSRLDDDVISLVQNREWYTRTLELLGVFGASADWSPSEDWERVHNAFLLGLEERDTGAYETDPDGFWLWLLDQREALEQLVVIKIIVEQLLRHSKLDVFFPVIAAIEYGSVNALEYLLALPESDELTQREWNRLLNEAVWSGNASVVEVLLRDGRADPVTLREDIIEHAYDTQNGPMLWALIQDRRLAPYYNRDEILSWAIGDNNQELAEFLRAQKR